ncbi:MAG: 3-deoxy-manno-octulosonate cytidylyltransferase [Verrucomicrobiae bacterium]
MSRTAIIIPARWGSTRFPGKPLHLIAGKPLLQHVWERCLRIKGADQIIVATDDTRILEAAFAFGAEVALTSAKHPSGTDRLAEVAKNLPSADILLNVQGDEPLLDPRLAGRVIEALRSDPLAQMSTAACPLAPDELDNPNCVKVVADLAGYALFFSRCPIPCDRDGDARPARFRHIGIYAYRRKFLLGLVRHRQSPLEKSEKLEQLRALEHGAKIRVVRARSASPGVDTPADAEAVERAMRDSPSPRRARGGAPGSKH